MPPEPVPADPGWDEDLAWLDRDPVTAAEREAWLVWLCEQDDDPFDAPQEYWDPEASAPPPGQDELTAEELAGIRQAAAAVPYHRRGQRRRPALGLAGTDPVEQRPARGRQQPRGRFRRCGHRCTLAVTSHVPTDEAAGSPRPARDRARTIG